MCKPESFLCPTFKNACILSSFFCTIFLISSEYSFYSYAENMSLSTKVWYSFIFFVILSGNIKCFSYSLFRILLVLLFVSVSDIFITCWILGKVIF